MTFGNVVIYTTGSHPDGITPSYDGEYRINFGTHEEAHTFQYQYMGPLFPFIYLLNGFADQENFLEDAADKYSWLNKPRWKNAP